MNENDIDDIEKIKEWDRKQLGEGGSGKAGVMMAGVGMVGAGNEYDVIARYKAAGVEAMSFEWASILEKYGALKWSGDQRRPYIWLWEVKDLTGLKPYANQSWEKWASHFYFNNAPVKPSIRNYPQTDWRNKKEIQENDINEKIEINLPKILEELKKVF